MNNEMNAGSSSPNVINTAAEESKKSKKGLIIGFCAVLVLLLGGIAAIVATKKGRSEPSAPAPAKPTATVDGGSFALNFFKKVYETESGNKNIMVSPYSMDAVWRLALGGAQGETKQEILDVIGAHSVVDYPQLKVANGLFVRDSYKDYVKQDYAASFDGDLRYDSFASATPINDWVKEKTDGMIEGILDEAPDSEMVAILLNALAMEEDWASEFEAFNTMPEEFTGTDGSVMENAAMMNGDADEYFKTDNAEGIVKYYWKHDDGSAFEFVGILPNGSISDYMAALNQDELAAMAKSTIVDGSKEFNGSINSVSVGLPKFSYDFDISNAKEVMQDLGIKKAFDEDEADFGAMIEDESGEYNFYINSVLQRAHVETNEEGTKAAVVSALGMDATSAMDKNTYNYYRVDFNRPFIYLIRDKESKEIIFAGIVETPEEWSGEGYKF